MQVVHASAAISVEKHYWPDKTTAEQKLSLQEFLKDVAGAVSTSSALRWCASPCPARNSDQWICVWSFHHLLLWLVNSTVCANSSIVYAVAGSGRAPPVAWVRPYRRLHRMAAKTGPQAGGGLGARNSRASADQHPAHGARSCYRRRRRTRWRSTPSSLGRAASAKQTRTDHVEHGNTGSLGIVARTLCTAVRTMLYLGQPCPVRPRRASARRNHDRNVHQHFASKGNYQRRSTGHRLAAAHSKRPDRSPAV